MVKINKYFLNKIAHLKKLIKKHGFYYTEYVPNHISLFISSNKQRFKANKHVNLQKKRDECRN